MISLERVSFRYPKTRRDILTDLSCTFAPGERVAVTGPNGCGKTTLVRLLTGILRPTAGKILLDGTDAASLELWGIGRIIGCVFQDPSRQLFCATVREEIEYGLRNLTLPEEEIAARTARYLAFFRLEHLEGAFPGTLSQGEKQRVLLAAVLAMGTRYVLLDEPTASLDMRAREELGGLLTDVAAAGSGVIFVSHERAFIEKYADRELVLG